LTGDRAAYEYLCGSIEQFPGREALAGTIREAGFSHVCAHALTFGIVALHEATAA
jgi:demethylmenaquinone methyltransferase/2-methoxy-6-polyprenyl-1,4-benzoquinol methylase